MLMRRLGVTGIALLLAACTATGPLRKEPPTHPQIENISRPESVQQVGGGGGGGM
jgi:hypothetical protein